MKAVVWIGAVLLLTACQPRTQESSDFYSYVDAQGNLVVMERSAPAEQGTAEGKADSTADSQAGTSASDAPASPEATPAQAGQVDARPVDQAFAEKKHSSSFQVFDLSEEPEVYQTDEQVEAKLLEEQRDRFVTYFGPDGEVITRPLDMVEERDAVARRKAEEEQQTAIVVESEQHGYQESQLSVPVDCCAAIIATADTLKADRAVTFRFGARGRSVSWGAHQVRAEAIKIGPDVKQLSLKTFKHSSGYVHPYVLMLNAEGEPVLAIDNPFTHRKPETWASMGYLEGTLPVEPGHSYAVFVLPYWSMSEGMRSEQVAKMPFLEADSWLSESGELYIRATGL